MAHATLSGEGEFEFETLSAAQCNAAWLGDMLGRSGIDADVASVSVEPVGTGQLGETVRFTVDYASAPKDAPATVIGKFASSDPTSRSIAAAWSLYEREVRFYREIAAEARIATPACFGAEMAADGTFALLLEDLAPARPGDQFAGLTPDDADRVVRESARLHAAFWGRGDDPALAWLDSGPLAQPFYAADVFRGAWAGFSDRYADLLSDEQRETCERLARDYDSYIRLLERPRCITHNDYRPDNILFGPGERLKVVDWQSVALGHNAVDVAYLIGGAFTPEARRESERALLEAYLDELLRQGVSDYGMAELEADYRHFAFAGINVAVGAAMLVKRTERGDRMFLTMLDRHVAHVRDWDSLAAIGN